MRYYVLIVTAVAVVYALAAATMVMLVWGKEGGDWSNVDPEVREWIKSLKMPDSPEVSCCGEADAYEADIGEQTADGQNYAIITGYRGTVTNALPIGTKLLIPPRKVQNKQGNPSGHVIVFASSGGTVYCFIPNGGM